MRGNKGLASPRSYEECWAWTPQFFLSPDCKIRQASLVAAAKDPYTWILGQGRLRLEEGASPKLRPERWEMFVVERAVVGFGWGGVDTRVDGDDVTHIVS